MRLHRQRSIYHRSHPLIAVNQRHAQSCWWSYAEPIYVTHVCTIMQPYLRRRPDRSFVSCLSVPISSSSSSSSSSSLQPSASRFSPRIPKLRKKPSKETPAKMPNGIASPFGWILVAAVKRDPDIKGPAARPAAESVWAKPFRVPRTL